jgi:hypothetical protein
VSSCFSGHGCKRFRRNFQGGQTERQRVVKKMFDYLKHTVYTSVSEASRYDFATRRAAITKLKNMTIQGSNFTKLRFGRKLFGSIFILKFWTNFPQKTVYINLYEYYGQ